MEFPIYQVPYLGNGMTIGLNAIIHVLISHGLAIGLVTLIVLSEYIGHRRNSAQWENLARTLIKPTVIIITGIGAVTGAGIWFITSALAPVGIGSMLRIFFWPWFAEWIAFTLEVIVLLFYYFTWDKWQGGKKRRHIQLGFWYVIFSSASAFLITGILGFMLTSDGWPWNNNFFAAFFNPSYIPQLFIRLSFGMAIGAMVMSGYLLMSKQELLFKKSALKYFSTILIVALIAWGLSAFWYFSVVPSTFKTHAVFVFLTSFLSQPWLLWLIVGLALGLIVAFALLARSGSIKPAITFYFPAILLVVGFVTQFERVREFIRGPYLMPGYMYANEVLMKEKPYLDKNGALENSFWFNRINTEPTINNKGAWLFYKNCSACHTINGINDIRKRVEGRTREGIFVIVGNTNRMVPFMPPFSGTRHERKLLADFIYTLANEKSYREAPGRYINVNLQKGGEHE